MRIIPREEYGAEKPRKAIGAATRPSNTADIHHTVTQVTGDSRADARAVQRAAFARGFADTSYHYLIHPITGEIFEGRKSDRLGAHNDVGNRNRVAYGIAFIGNTTTQVPNDKAASALEWLLNFLGVLRSQIYPHSHWKATQCCGNGGRAIVNNIKSTPGRQVPTEPPKPQPQPTPTNDWLTEVIKSMQTLDLRNAHVSPVRHHHVDNLQGLLVAAGYRITVDGIAGNQTKESLMQFQAKLGLSKDAICGPNSWKALITY